VLVLLFVAAIGIMYWGIMAMVNTNLVNENFKHLASFDLNEVEKINSDIYDFININTRLNGAFNFLIASLIIMFLILGIKNRSKHNIIVASIGGLLGYAFPFFIMDLKVGYIGFFEKFEVGFIILMFFITLFSIFSFRDNTIKNTKVN
jgi:hypothetical protein